jgi:hypothetical protein
VQRRVSSRASIQVARQRIQVGMTHARKIVTVVTETNSFPLVIDGETVAAVPSHQRPRNPPLQGQRHPPRKPVKLMPEARPSVAGEDRTAAPRPGAVRLPARRRTCPLFIAIRNLEGRSLRWLPAWLPMSEGLAGRFARHRLGPGKDSSEPGPDH